MRRIVLAAAWMSFICLPVMETQAANRSWGRWWRYDTACYPVVQPQPAQQVAAPPTAPTGGVTQQNLSVEPDVVVPIEPNRSIWSVPERSSRSPFPGEAQQRRLRPGTPHR